MLLRQYRVLMVSGLTWVSVRTRTKRDSCVLREGVHGLQQHGSVEQFTFQLAGAHAGLVEQLGPAMGHRRYVQGHRVVDVAVGCAAEAVRPHDSPNGGLTEVWFTDREAMRAGLTGKAATAGSHAMEAGDVKVRQTGRHVGASRCRDAARLGLLHTEESRQARGHAEEGPAWLALPLRQLAVSCGRYDSRRIAPWPNAAPQR